MATYYTTSYKNNVLGTFRGVPFSTDNLYLALMLNPSAFSEVSNGEYNRRAVTFDVGSGTLTNSSEVRFDATTTNWGTVTGVGLASGSTGAIFMTADISPSLSVIEGRQVVWAAGQLTLTL